MNDKKSEFSEPKPRPNAAPPTMKCFIVPVDQMEIIRDALREAPYKVARPVVEGIATLQIADVPVAPQPPG